MTWQAIASGDGGIILRRGGGACLRCGVAAGICCGAVPLNELELNYFLYIRPLLVLISILKLFSILIIFVLNFHIRLFFILILVEFVIVGQ